MRPTIIIRSLLGRVGTYAVAALAAVLIGQALIVSSASHALRLAAYPVFVVVVVWLLWYYPRVRIDDDGVEVVNPLRTVRVSYADLTHASARGALRVHTRERGYTAWAAPARGGYRDSTRPAAIAPTVQQGRETQVESSDAATVARLIELEQVERTDKHYRRHAAPSGAPVPAGWRWNTVPVALLAGSALWVAASALF